jgi:hypothetical protein
MPNLSKSSITFEGPFFKGKPDEQVRKNLTDAVHQLTEEGQRLVQEGVKPQHPTGYTRSHVEGKYYNQGRPLGSLYGKVRMEPGLSRPPDSTGGRRPYIVASVLESGRSGGTRGISVSMSSRGTRVRETRKQGAKRQAALWMFRNATRILQQRADQIRADVMTKGID